MRNNLLPQRGSTGKRSRVLSARLHPDEEHEARALEVWDALQQQGYNPRQIVTDALLHASGHTPEMFRRDGRIDTVIDALEERLEHLKPLDQIDHKLDLLLERFEASIAEVLRSIKRADPDGLRRFAGRQEEDDSADLDEAFLQNARRAARKTLRQRERR